MEPFLDVVRALGRTLWRWGLVIWVCRVPVASTLAGGFLLALSPQARDFFADLGIAWWEWAIFFGLVFAWAWIVHSGARRALQHDDWVPEAHGPGGLSEERRKALQAEFYWPALIVPRALGLLVFFFIGWGVCQTRRNLQGASALPMAEGAVTVTLWLLIATIAVMVVFVAMTWQWRSIQRRWPAVARFSTAPNHVLLIGTTPVLAGLWQSRGVPGEVGRRLASVNRTLLAARVLILLALLVTLVDPHLVAAWVPRVFFAPVLFAGVVLLLGEFAAWSHRLRTPLLLIVAGFAATLLYFVERFHDVHWIATRESSTPRQITFETAVKRWMRVNDCDPAAGRECPRPILIAGAGGASRAAFLTASVVGGLMDLDRAEFGDVRNRIFAMSTVSGSSVGAAVVRAAMADAVERGRPHEPPCVTGGTRSWFGILASDYGMKGPFDPKTSWRDCFQAIIAGDFLSPVMVGLAYRDTFPLGNPFNGTAWWADRAQLLEQGFERRYHRMTTNERARTCRDVPAKGPVNKADQTGLCRPFGYLPDPEIAGAWLPLLFINSTSVSTGRRIIIADVPIGKEIGQAEDLRGLLLPFAYDLWELRGHSAGAGLEDIRLSTAAGISARFPVISPHGILRQYKNGRGADGVVDRVVDGGYFENDGLATIADVAAALKSFKLEPVVIRIVNEPSKAVADERKLGPGRPPAPDDAERTPFEGTLSIVRTLTATRSGHEDGHTAYLVGVLGEDKHRLYEIGVFPWAPDEPTRPSMKQMVLPQESYPLCRHTVLSKATLGDVSMSWWMSQPLQVYLDAQMCVQANWRRLACELREGRKASGAECKPMAVGARR